MPARRCSTALTLAAVAVLAGCSSVPDAQEPSASLLVPDDLAAPFDEALIPEPGILPSPSVYLCEAADEASRRALESLDWQAETSLTANYTIVQEAVLAGDPDDVEATFAALRDGLIACLEIPATGQGERPFTSEAAAIGRLGDDTVATRDVYEDGTLFTNVLVRRGSVLALVVTGETPGADRQYFDDDVVGEIAATAVDKLP
jgi:hypothetical protein